MKVLIIIPAYNEASAIGHVIAGLSPLQHTLVVVNDGSHDDTAAIAARHGATVLTHCVNLGQGAALQTGIEYARQCRADIIVTFDADNQHKPSDIPVLLDAMQTSGARLLLGYPG
jgi:glycosyltransferase involved in cell wall biosynthesis